MSGEIGYLTVAAADVYFSTRLSSDAWTAAADSGDAKKIAALTTAYDRLYYSGLFDIPDFTSAGAAELVLLKKAQAEMALYLLQHLEDEDRRKGLQAQGVVEAGIVKEKYSEGGLDDLPIPPFVSKMLEEFAIVESGFYVAKVERDDTKDGVTL